MEPRDRSGTSLGGLEGIAELLRCYICMEGLKDTTLCPHCCKLVCYSCITRWINENRADCPHCRMSLSVRELGKMPLFDSLVKVVEELRSKQESVGKLPSNEAQTCPTHSHQLSVYCETCRAAICHECALFSGEHKEHSFQPLDKLHKKHKRVLETELQRLRDRMRDILSYVLQVEKSMEEVRASKSKTKKEIQQTVDRLYSEIEGRIKGQQTKLDECRVFLRSQALKVMTVAHDLERQMASGSLWAIMNKQGELKKEVRESLDKLYNHPLKMKYLNNQKELNNWLVPGYTTGLFIINHFKELQRKGEEVYSDNLHLDGLTWRLKVYPNGHHEDIGRYLAVFMELSEGYDKITSYQYCIEMLYNCTDKYPQRNYSREYVSEFGDGECWGYKKYYQLSRLASEGFLKDDSLQLRFSVRQVNYHDKCKDLALYMGRVREERNALRDQLKETQKQLSNVRAENKKLTSSVRPRSSPSHTRGESKSAHRITSRRPTFSHPSRHSHESPRSARYQLSASQQTLGSPHHGSPKRGYSKLTDDRHLTVSRSRHLHDVGLSHRRRSADPAMTFDPEEAEFPPQFLGRAYHSQCDHQFEDSNSDHGSLQSLVHEEGYINDAGSNSTLIAGPFKPQDLSQAEFVEEEGPEITIVPPPIESEMPFLSQPSSPPKSRVGKSLTDLHALSHSQQVLSQPYPEYLHYPGMWEGSAGYHLSATEQHWYHDGRFKRPVAKPNISASQGQIHRMRSDPHLNYDHVASKSSGSGLKKVTEVDEGRETRGHRNTKVKAQQLDKRHVQATVVSRRTESLKPVDMSIEDKSTRAGAGLVSAAGKSSSTSSLNLSQIL